MHLAARPGPAEVRGVLRYRRAEGAARQQADEHRQVLQARDDLFDADRGDVQLWHIGRKIGIALVGADDEGPGLGDREIAPGHAGIGLEDQRPGRLALGFRQVVDVAVIGVGADRA